jgi:hypothetical protein
VTLTAAIFERAIAYYAKAAASTAVVLDKLPKPSKKGKAKEDDGTRASAEQTYAAYKAAEAAIWQRYSSWDDNREIKQRAARACPQSGTIWRRYFEATVSPGANESRRPQALTTTGTSGRGRNATWRIVRTGSWPWHNIASGRSGRGLHWARSGGQPRRSRRRANLATVGARVRDDFAA